MRLNVLLLGPIHYLVFFLAVSVDHPISKFYDNDPEFHKFRDNCSKTGTTEESIAQAEKIGFKTKLLAINPLNQNEKSASLFCKLCFDGLWIWCSLRLSRHDQRDLDFALKYDLPVKTVVNLLEGNDNFRVKK